MLALIAFLGLFDTFGEAHSYTQVSPNGRYVLVMLAPESVGSDPEIRSAYQASGLYVVGDPKLLWPMPSFETEVAVASDGDHVVGFQSYVFDRSDVVLRFYNRGELVKSYRRLDLGFLLFCRRTTSGAVCIEDVRVLEPGGRIQVRPYIGFPIEFDLEGNLRWSSPAMVAALSTGTVVLGLLGWFVRRRLSKEVETR